MNIRSLVAGAGGAPPLAAPAAAASPAGPTSISRAASLQTSFLGGLLGLDKAGAQARAEQLGAALTRFVRSAVTGASTSASSASSSSASGSSGALAFLKDAKLSVEEKLARLMVYLSDKYEKQLEQKLQQYSDLENGKATSSGSKKSTTSTASSLKEGLSSLLSKAGLGNLLSGGTMQKLLGQVTGPVLAGAATALGLPALAPAILKAGPLLGSVASGAVSVLAGSGSSSTSASSSKSASTSSGSSSSSSAPSEKQLMTEIQILQEKQKEMFTLVSNILRSQHDTKMAVIGNVR